jgi:hypothetical protein
VEHHDIWLPPEHGQIDSESLDVYDEVPEPESRPTCGIARDYPTLHRSLSINGCRVIHRVPQLVEGGVDSGIGHMHGGLLSPPVSSYPSLLRCGWGWWLG